MGVEGATQSFKGKPTEYPTSAALPHYESAFTTLPYWSCILLNVIYFLTVVHAFPDIPELKLNCIPDITVPHRNPITSYGPPAMPITTMGPNNYI